MEKSKQLYVCEERNKTCFKKQCGAYIPHVLGKDCKKGFDCYWFAVKHKCIKYNPKITK
jgi:hypothetical protein